MSKATDSTTILTCPRCRQPLAGAGVDGLCANCLGLLPFDDETTAPGDFIAPAEPPKPVELAQYFPQLEIEGYLGRGGMGMVYRARQRSLERSVALKLLAPELADDPDFSRRFAEEARLLAALSHPGIVTIYDSGRAGGFFYLLMEFVDGQNLRELLKTRCLERAQAIAFMLAICEALHAAHKRGIIHRDIKPENLLLDSDFSIKIADFGIARMLDESSIQEPSGPATTGRSALTLALGTPAYIAPEQLTDAAIDHRVDIYSLGIVFHEMLSGMRPDPGCSTLATVLDPGLKAIVLKATATDPADRYQSAEELAQALRQSRPPANHSWWRLGSATAAVLVATVVLAFSLGDRTPLTQARTDAAAAVAPSVNPQDRPYEMDDDHQATNREMAESLIDQFKEELTDLSLRISERVQGIEAEDQVMSAEDAGSEQDITWLVDAAKTLYEAEIEALNRRIRELEDGVEQPVVAGDEAGPSFGRRITGSLREIQEERIDPLKENLKELAYKHYIAVLLRRLSELEQADTRTGDAAAAKSPDDTSSTE